MHQHDTRSLAHSHRFSEGDASARRHAVLAVSVVTLLTMLVEVVAGWWSGSLALLADGVHMGTHALALGGAALAYHLSERASRAGAGLGYAFGGWKIEVLAAYTSALALLATAVWLVWEAVTALRAPPQVAWTEAMWIAVLGLVVNAVCAWILGRAAAPGQDAGLAHTHVHGHGHDHERSHGHGHGHDHNFNAAYLHVLADALTSVLAIFALAAGAWFQVRWLDPAVALLGALIIGRWSITLLRDSSRALVDNTADPTLAQQVRQQIEIDGDARVADLHVWQIAGNAWCAAVSVVADAPREATEYRRRLSELTRLRHVTIEVHRCGAVHEASATGLSPSPPSSSAPSPAPTSATPRHP